MAEARARVFEYGVTLDGAWAAASDRGGDTLPHDEQAWTPEHLLLVALARCSLTSLAYHARRADLTTEARATATGKVTVREEDGRFAFVEIAVDAEVSVMPAPDEETVRALLAKAERDCFVGASLSVTPLYRWHVNGEEIA
jgi:organic hydroperoxide reductase OsmC/OhrA